MPRTENQKALTAYLPLELYEKIEEFKLEEDLKSDSKAINTILERWFFGEAPIPAIAKTYNFEERLKEVEGICEKLVEQFVKLTVPNTVLNAVPNTVLNAVPDTVPDTVPHTVPDAVPRKESLKDKWERELEERYRWDDGCLRIKQADGTIKISSCLIGDVSKRHNTCKLFDSLTDSQFRIDINKLVPRSELLSESTSELIKGISQRALAQRLGCSHPFIKKLQKSGEISAYSKQHDPAGLEWEFRDGKYYPKVLSPK